MTILEKVTIQNQDITKIYLFKEGIFYKAYNEGAFLLRSKNYKVSVKKIKSIENEVLSIGFPVVVFEKLKKENSIKEFEQYALYNTTEAIHKDAYDNWKTTTIKEVFNQHKKTNKRT